MDDTQSVDLAVVGGGPAGLWRALEHRRKHPDSKVVVLEARDRPGGWVSTSHQDGCTFESGPQSLRPTPSTASALERLDLIDSVVGPNEDASTRYIALDGRLVKLPAKPPHFLTTKALSLRAKLRAVMETRQRSESPPRESIHDFVVRRLGAGFAPLVDAFVTGIFAGDPKQLEVSSAFPQLVAMEKSHGSLIRALKAKPKPTGPSLPPTFTLKGGMQTLTDRMAERLGSSLRCGLPARQLRRSSNGWTVAAETAQFHAKQVALALPAGGASSLLAGHDAALAHDLKKIRHAGVANVHLVYAADDVARAPRGFGFLIPSGEQSPLLGVLDCSSSFAGQAPDGRHVYRAMLGGIRAPDMLDATDSELTRIATSGMRAYLGVGATPIDCRISRAREAIPQYEPGHGDRIERIRHAVRQLGSLEIRGCAIDGIAISAQLEPIDGD